MTKKTVISRYNPEESKELDNIIRDSYDDFVRIERRNLIAVSGIIIILFFGNANPTGFAFFGFKFPSIDTQMLFLIMSLMCLYFLIAFLVYSYPDFKESRKKWKELITDTMTMSSEFHWFYIEIENALSTGRYLVWLIFQYILPVVLGVFALLVGVCKIA